MQSTMKAVGYVDSLPLDKPDALRNLQLPVPRAGGRDLLVRVHAVSVNPVDTKVRLSRAGSVEQPVVLGWDASGIVEAVGSEVTLFRPGDKVWYAGDITRPGSNAELQLVDERIVGPMPSSLSFAQAAALPLTAITAWELLFDRLGVPEHVVAASAVQQTTTGTLLIVGAAGGVGSILTQLARKLTALRVVGTATRPESATWISSLGAHDVVDLKGSLSDGLRDAGIDAVTHVASLTHTEQHFEALVEALAPQGKLALIDDPKNPLDARALKRKSLSLHWELMFTRAIFQTPDMIAQHELLTRVAQLVDQGHLQTTVQEHFGVINADNLRRAHALLESNKSRGKIVLEGF